MTRGFDDVTLTFYETKPCDHDMTWLDTENKFLDPFWMWGQSSPN